MALSHTENFGIPSFHKNTNISLNNFSMFNDAHDHSARTAEKDIASPNYCNSNCLRLNENGKTKPIIQGAEKSKNIAVSRSWKNTTRDLRLFSENEAISTVSSCTLNHFKDDTDDSSDNALERKYTQVFFPHQTTEGQQHKKHNKKRIESRQSDDHEMGDKENIPNAKDSHKELKLIQKTLKNIFKFPLAPPVASRDTGELRQLYRIVKTLKKQQDEFRHTIKEQQDQLNIFHLKYLQAQNSIQSQKYEIKQLHSTNARLENELNVNMISLKEQFKDKIRQVSHLPGAAKADKAKADKLRKDNSSLISKLQQVKQELAVAKAKQDEAGHKRIKTLNKLKTSERDLKIFRTQNNILKIEKRSLFEELTKLKGLNDDLKATSSKNVSRQKKCGETKQRLLQNKIVDLEFELNQTQNSTKVLVEERDKLIADLNKQLSTLVHNFEVSQRHIRILRRHIYSLSGGQVIPVKVA